MKNKFHNQISLINYITSTDMFKLLFFLNIIVSMYASFILGVETNNFIDSVFIPFQFPIFNIILFSLLFLNNLNTCSILKKDFDFYIIRLKNRENYIKTVIKNSIFTNLFYLLIFFLLYFAFLFIAKGGNFEIYNYKIYSISNILFVSYYLLRYIIILIITNSIISIIYLNFNSVVSFIIEFIVLAGFMVKSYELNISTFSVTLFWNLFDGSCFENFSLDICYSLGLILVLEIIFVVLYRSILGSKRVMVK